MAQEAMCLPFQPTWHLWPLCVTVTSYGGKPASTKFKAVHQNGDQCSIHSNCKLVLPSLPRRQVSLNYLLQLHVKWGKGVYRAAESRFEWPVHSLLNGNWSYGLKASNVNQSAIWYFTVYIIGMKMILRRIPETITEVDFSMLSYKYYHWNVLYIMWE